LYIVSFNSIFFNSQIRSILQLEKRLRKTTNINKIIINKREVREAREIEVEVREIRIKAKTIEASTRVDTKANAKANTRVVTTIATTTINKKYLLELRKQFVCIYINFTRKIVLILLSYILLFNNL